MILYVLAAIAAFAKIIFYAKILSPVDFGIFTFCIMITGFISYLATMGILDGMLSKVPVLIGKGQNTVKIRSSGFFWIFFITICLGIPVLIGFALITNEKLSIELLISLIFFFLGTVILSALLTDLQIRELSTENSKILLLKGIIAPIFAFYLVPYFNVKGVLIAEIISIKLCIIICFFLWCNDLSLSFSSLKNVRPLISQGLPFSINYFFQHLANNVDRWAVHFVFGLSVLGTYAFAMNFATMGYMFLGMVHFYMAPRLLRKYGKTNNIDLLIRQSKRLAFISFAIFILGAIPTFILFPLFVDEWFQQYSKAKDLIVYVYIGTLAITISFFDIIFRAIGNGKQLASIQIIVVLTSIIACLLTYLNELSLTYYAIIFLGARILTSGFGWSLAIRYASFNTHKN